MPERIERTHGDGDEDHHQDVGEAEPEQADGELPLPLLELESRGEQAHEVIREEDPGQHNHDSHRETQGPDRAEDPLRRFARTLQGVRKYRNE